MSKISYSQAIYAKSQRFEHTEHHRLDQSTISREFSISRRFFFFFFQKLFKMIMCLVSVKTFTYALVWMMSMLDYYCIFKERKRLMKENTQTDTNQTIPSFGSSVFCRPKTIFFLFELSIFFFIIIFSIFFSHRQKRRSEDILHRKEKTNFIFRNIQIFYLRYTNTLNACIDLKTAQFWFMLPNEFILAWMVNSEQGGMRYDKIFFL